MSRIKAWLKRCFLHLPNESKLKLYRRLFQGKTPLFSGALEWCKSKLNGERDCFHDLFVDYSKPEGVYTADSLLKMLSGFDAVSFDIFDTLLFRNVDKPTDVFVLIEQRLKLSNFAQCREQAEWEARQEKHRQMGSWEVTLNEIYQKISQFTAEQKQNLQEAELSIEREQLMANPVMKQVVEGLITMGIPLVVISDMYLDAKTLTDFLQGCGFSPFERLYVSSEQGVSKSDGKLFQKVKWLEHWGDKRVVHIGDNFHSDVKMAKEWMEKSIHYIR